MAPRHQPTRPEVDLLGQQLLTGYQWNSTLMRWELWCTLGMGPAEVLCDAKPARIIREPFIGGPQFVPAILGLLLGMAWTVNGRKGGAVDPDGTCFPVLNAVGGGIMARVVAAGGADGDYSAIHWGDNYPLIPTSSASMQIQARFSSTAGCAHLAGMVDATRPAGTAAFAVPNNGIYVYYDTAIDGNMHWIVRVGGVNVHDVNLGPPTGADSHGTIYFNDAGTEVNLVLNGVLLNWAGALPAVQMQPYAAVVARGVPGADKDLHLKRFLLITED